jgi:hypothetical protein
VNRMAQQFRATFHMALLGSSIPQPYGATFVRVPVTVRMAGRRADNTA